MMDSHTADMNFTVCHAIYRVCDNGVFLETCDHAFRVVADEYLTQKNVDVTNVSEFGWFLKRYESLLLEYENGSQRFELLHDHGGALWSIEIEACGDLLLVTGERMRDSGCNTSLEAISPNFLNHLNCVSMLVERSADGFIVRSRDAEIALLTGIEDGDNLGKIIEQHLLMLKSVSVINHCIESGKMFRFLDEYSSSSLCLQFLCTAIPINHVGRCSVLLLFYKLTARQYYELHKKNVYIEQYFISENIGAAFCDADTLSVNRSDELFNELIMLNPTLLSASSALREAHNTGGAEFELRELANAQGKSVQYNLVFAPLGELRQMLVIASPSKNIKTRFDSLSARLTKREKEVVEHVLSGCKNSYIALELGVTEGTIKKTLNNAFAKLNVSSLVEIIRLVYR
ncbi:MAG: helix-turn-helix transcriptional regulator [Oscillospiraceae bacterium]